MEDSAIQEYLEILPFIFRKDVLRFKDKTDQKLALMARLMLKKSLDETGKSLLINEWEKGIFNKPQIENWYSFNISHSGKFSVFVYGDNKLGVDIEEKCPMDYEELIHIFHSNEKQYVFDSLDTGTRFYEIWTKKEALLKAVGLGLINELSSLDCSEGQVSYEGKLWFFHALHLAEGYAFSVCSSSKIEEIVVDEFKINL
jgi:4'-phosphopantetheinyl transferase